MSLHRASPCKCTKEIGMSMERTPQLCEHKNVYHRVKQLTRSPSPAKPRKGVKRSQPKRDWSDARRKVEEEGVCRVCGSNENVEAAHIIGRGSDEFKGGKFGPLWVNPDSIVPLCGQFAALQCHVKYDAHVLDVLEFLTPAEQIQAVKDAGGIEAARMRVSPSSYRILEEAA